MKHSIVTLLTFLSLLPALSGQSPLYLEFDPTCVNQLEYHFTYTGKNLLMYSVPKGANELYFFVISDKEPATTGKMPNGAVSCQNDAINATLVDNINAGGRLAYLVFKAQNGFLSYQIETAGYIARSGTYFAFRSPNYDFVMDTASIDYARNLSRPGIASPVYLTGRRSQECLQLYAFRLEPSQPDLPRADVEVIPGIGIISDRTGHNGSEMEQNIYRLSKVNGIVLDDYVYAVCHNSKDKTGNTSSFITSLPPDAANPNDAFRVDNPFVEQDKESYYTQPVRQNGAIQLAKCPTPPGYGYHVVQPGDSLHSIARIYNVDANTLMRWNQLQSPSGIRVCDKLWVKQPPASENMVLPVPTAGYHVVQKGETLYGIGRKYNLTEAAIRQINNFPASGNVTIIPGQKLLVSKTGATPAQTGGNNAPPQYSASDKPVNNTAGSTQPGATYYNTPGPNSSTSGKLSYKVKKGETLNSVAWNYGYTGPYLRHINRNLKNLPAGNNDPLPEGIILTVSDTKNDREDLASFAPPTIPNAGGGNKSGNQNKPLTASPIAPTFEYIGEYIVQTDDTLASIAQRYGLSPEKLAAANSLKPDQQPAPRSILKIPK